MAQVSARKINDKTWERVWDHLVQILCSNRRREDMNKLLYGLLTATERVMLAKRLMVSILVLSDWPTRAIADELKLSYSTVHKFKLYLEASWEYRKLVEKNFPKKLEYEKDAKTKSGLEMFLEDMWVGRHKRSRLRDG